MTRDQPAIVRSLARRLLFSLLPDFSGVLTAFYGAPRADPVGNHKVRAMPDFSAHESITVALFLLTLPLLMIATRLNGGRARQTFALLALATGTAASIGVATRPTGPSTWAPMDFPTQARATNSTSRGAATYRRGQEPEDAEFIERGSSGNDVASGNGVVLAAFGRSSASSQQQSTRDCPHCPDMIALKPAYAQLGARASDPRSEAVELPQRIISFRQPFAIGRTEITVAQYSTFAAATGRAAPDCAEYRAATGAMPVECVTFADARAYAAWLSETTGRTYRLPSAAEWEYAARAGSDQAFPAGDNLPEGSANIGQSAFVQKPAGSFPANGFGLRDMVGSLAEMVSDCWAANLKNVPTDGQPAISGADCSRRTLKDAAWWELPVFARVSARRPLDPATARPGIGFRVVRE